MSGPVKLLIVEDSATQREYLSCILEDRGFQVEAARNGREALAAVRRRRPDLVISDVTMPVMDGFELCSRITRDPALATIPVILLTALSHPADVFRGLESGASHFVTKPFEDGFLLSRIDYVLANVEMRRQSGAELGIVVSFGGSKHFITAERVQIIDLLLSSFAVAVQKNLELEQLNRELRSVRQELGQKNQELQVLALHDELTGLFNRRGFNLLADQLVKLARRTTGGALLFLDLDGLKEANDTLGHDGGDELLCAASTILTSTFREAEVVGRVGGDEFAVVFACEVPDGAEVALRRLAESLAQYGLGGRLAGRLSVSIGMVTFAAGDTTTLVDLLRLADEDMYRNKSARKDAPLPRAKLAPGFAGAGHGEMR